MKETLGGVRMISIVFSMRKQVDKLLIISRQCLAAHLQLNDPPMVDEPTRGQQGEEYSW